MKKFKLLKDLPGAKAWDIIVYEDWDVYFEECSDNTTPSFQTVDEHLLWILERMITELEYNWWLEEVEETPKSIYELKNRGAYFYINDRWEIIDVDWLLWSGFERRLEMWNVFLTEEEAEKELRKRKALARIKRWIWKNKALLWLNRDEDWTYHWWYRVAYYKDTNELEIILETAMTIDGIMFMYKSDAERCLVECKKDWGILFDLKE